jgi:hypothetical protein
MGWKPSRGMTLTNRALWDESKNLTRQAGRQDMAYRQYEEFDPTEAYRESAGGAWSMAKRDLADQLEELAGQGAAAGRLNTGFFDRDQGELIQRTTRDYQDRIAQGAMQAAGMEQGQRRDLLQHGQQQQQSYLDLLAGNFDREAMLQGIQDQNKGGFWKTLGGIAQFGAKLGGAAIKGF